MPRFPDLGLSVIIPAYNEEASLQQMVPRAFESLRGMVGRFALILIDDCCTDRTAELGAELAREFPEIRFERNERNLRQGGTLERGFAMARYELVTHNAVDYPFD